MTSMVRSDYFYETRRWVLPDRVVASRITMGSTDPDLHLDGFKPYVYKGVGHDVLTEDMNLDEWGNELPPPKPKPTRSDHKDRAYRWLRVVRAEVERQYRAEAREAERRRREARRQARREAEAKAEAKWLADREAARVAWPRGYEHYTVPGPDISPRPRVSRNTPSHPRPSPGWKPMTGADIEDLFAQLEDG